jgi:TP901 family phage tail tape measure protein
MANNIDINKTIGEVDKLNASLQETAERIKVIIELQKTSTKELNSVKGLTDTNENLNKTKSAQNLIEKEGETLLNQRNKLIAAQDTSLKELTKSTIKEREAKKAYTDQIKAEDDAYKQLELKHKQAIKTAKTLAAQYGINSTEAKKAALEANKYGKELKNIDGSLGQHQRKVGGYFGAIIKSAIAAGAAFLTFRSAVSVVKNVMSTVKEFGSAMSSLKAITGASTLDMIYYGAAAIKTSGKTLQSATDIVKAYEKVGSAAPILLKNKKALADVTEQAIILSEATGGKLALEGSVDALTAAMNQFELPASKSKDIINVLAAGSLVGSSNVADLTESFKNAGTVAKSSNLTLEQTVALIEVLGEKQIKGAEAGTKLRGSLLKLKQAGLGYASGQFNLNDAIDEVNSKLATMGSNLEKDAYLSKIFGAENITVGQIIIENKDKFNELTKAVTGTNTAFEQQSIQNDNLAGDITKLSVKWETFILGLDKGQGTISRVFRNITQNVTSLIDWLTKLNLTELERADIKATKEADDAFKYYNESVNEAVKSVTSLEEAERIRSEMLTSELDKQNEKLIKYKKFVEDTADTNVQESFYWEAEVKSLQLYIDLLNGSKTIISNIKPKKDTESSIRVNPEKIDNELNYNWFVLQQEKEIKLRQDVADKKKKIEKNTQDYINDIIAEHDKKIEDSADKELKLQDKIREAKKNAAQQIHDIENDYFNQSAEIVNTIFDLGQSQRDRELEGIRSNYNAKITAAEGNSDLQEKLSRELAIKEAQIEREQAKSERNQALFNLAITTTQRALEIKASIAAASAASTILGPAGPVIYAPVIAMAYGQLAFLLGSSLLAAGVIASEPLPEVPGFFKGTENAPAGLAWIAERGAELIESKDGSAYLAENKQLVNLQGGEKISTAQETQRLLNSAIYNDITMNGNGGIEKRLDKMVLNLDKLVDKKNEPTINIINRYDSRYIKRHERMSR